MIKFTTPAFVKCDNPQERKELVKWLVGIGYTDIYKHAIFKDRVSVALHDCEAIDCNTNIPLFKALAAMNDENDREQWFVMDGELLPPETAFRSDIHPSLYRKATSEEVISHFKNKDYDK